MKIFVLPMRVWAVSESEGMEELSNRNKQHIPGFQGSCNPTIKLIFPNKAAHPAELGRRRENLWDPCHRIKVWNLAGIKWEMEFSPSPLDWNYILALKMRLSWCLVCSKSQNKFLGLNGFRGHGQNFLFQGLGYWMWCISFFLFFFLAV